MTTEVKRIYLLKMRLRYCIANKKQKTLILEEVCQICCYTRKHTIRALSDDLQNVSKRPGA